MVAGEAVENLHMIHKIEGERLGLALPFEIRPLRLHTSQCFTIVSLTENQIFKHEPMETSLLKSPQLVTSFPLVTSMVFASVFQWTNMPT